MKYQLLIVFLLGLSLAPAGSWAGAADISGTWAFTVEVMGPPGNLTIVFKQDGGKLSGDCSHPTGEYPVTGTLKGNKVKFSYTFTNSRSLSIKATYTGAIESPTKMTGDVEYTGGARGKWTATKKK
jgi:hypothetical protein